MTSREQILNKIKANRPPATLLPDQVAFTAPSIDHRLPLFIKSFESAGGIANLTPNRAGINALLQNNFTSPHKVLNTVAGVNYGITLPESLNKGHMLANLEVAVVQGNLGVAENGAVWVSEDVLPVRVLPFICEHLVLVVPLSKIVGNMHEAYAQLQVSKVGYGVFIAGPSRTADIEQSLVIGAHGPKRAHVFILEDE